MTTKAGSSRAHWFFVCFWYAVCRYLRQEASRCLYAGRISLMWTPKHWKSLYAVTGMFEKQDARCLRGDAQLQHHPERVPVQRKALLVLESNA